MMITLRHTAWVLTLACSGVVYSPDATAQEIFDTPLETVDRFYDLVSEAPGTIPAVFVSTAWINALLYDAEGAPQLNGFSPRTFREQMESLALEFEVLQRPVVLLERSYGHSAAIYCSSMLRFVDRATGDTLSTRSMQSFRLTQTTSGWLISSLLIQNEHPAYPIEGDLWPEELFASSGPATDEAPSVETTDTGTYDERRVYPIDQVDEPPVYPTSESLNDLMKSYEVVSEPLVGYTPFLVTIAEDGGASLGYVGDLSGFQISRAEAFTRSMLVWYPAVKSAASVKCNLTFYIRE